MIDLVEEIFGIFWSPGYASLRARILADDSAQLTGEGYVEVTGALAGDGLGYKDNATTISSTL